MTVTWQVRLAGTRPLSMLRISATQYLVICHLSSDTVARIVLVDISTQERVWNEIQPNVLIFGRARNALIEWQGACIVQMPQLIHGLSNFLTRVIK
jgi:hypothetical protein